MWPAWASALDSRSLGLLRPGSSAPKKLRPPRVPGFLPCHHIATSGSPFILTRRWICASQQGCSDSGASPPPDSPSAPVNVTVRHLKANSAVVSWDVLEDEVVIGFAISQQVTLRGPWEGRTHPDTSDGWERREAERGTRSKRDGQKAAQGAGKRGPRREIYGWNLGIRGRILIVNRCEFRTWFQSMGSQRVEHD